MAPAPSGGSMKPGPHRIVVTTRIYIANATIRDSETGGLPGDYG